RPASCRGPAPGCSPRRRNARCPPPVPPPRRTCTPPGQDRMPPAPPLCWLWPRHPALGPGSPPSPGAAACRAPVRCPGGPWPAGRVPVPDHPAPPLPRCLLVVLLHPVEPVAQLAGPARARGVGLVPVVLHPPRAGQRQRHLGHRPRRRGRAAAPGLRRHRPVADLHGVVGGPAVPPQRAAQTPARG